MGNKFFQELDGCCSKYEYIRDDSRAVKHKDFIGSLWGKYLTLADKNFLSDACKHFQERFWEMYLGVTLLEKGYDLNSDSPKGPEFFFSLNNKKVWVEAIAPSLGDGDDAVPELIPGLGGHEDPENKIILRICHAIREKHKKLQEFKQGNLGDKNDSYLLAINGMRMGIQAETNRSENRKLPFILKAVFPIGDQYGVWNRKTGEMVDSGFQNRDIIQKQNGSPVSTDVFLDEKYSDISAVIYSGVNGTSCFNLDGSKKQMGEDFQVVHNPKAKQPIEIGALGLGVEYWLESGEIKHR